MSNIEALRLATALNIPGLGGLGATRSNAAAELRRQHDELQMVQAAYESACGELRKQEALIAELVEALNNVRVLLLDAGYQESGPTIFDIDVALSKAKEQ